MQCLQLVGAELVNAASHRMVEAATLLNAGIQNLISELNRLERTVTELGQQINLQKDREAESQWNTETGR